MKLTKGVFTLFCSLVSTFSNAESTTVDSTKQSPIQNIFPNAYGSLEARHYFGNVLLNGDKSNSASRYQVRYTLGSTFFDGKLDTKAIFAANRAQRDTLRARGIEINSEYNLYSNDFFAITPSVNLRLPVDNHGTTGRFGGNLSAKYDLSTPAGVLTGETAFETVAVASSKAQERLVTRKQGDKYIRETTLTPEMSVAGMRSDKGNVVKNDNSVAVEGELLIGIKYQPSFVNGVTFKVRNRQQQELTPYLVYDGVSTDLAADNIAKTPNWDLSYNRVNQVVVRYEADNGFFVENDLRISSAQIKGSPAVKNILSVGTSVF